MTRAPVKLSREMKLLLLLLLMVGLIGLWYVLTNKPATTDLSQQPTSPTATGSGTGTGTTTGTATTPATGTTDVGNPDAVPITPPTVATPDSAVTPLTVQPDSQVQVETIPPFPTDGTTAATPAPAPTTAPGGINPDGIVSATPGSNPFKPLSLDASADGNGAPATTGSPAVTAPTSRPATTGQVTTTIPAQPVASTVDSLGNAGGPLGLSPIPGADGTVSGSSAPVSGGALPVPVIPGGDGSSGQPATTVLPVPPAATATGMAPGDITTGTTPGTGTTLGTGTVPGTVVLTPPAPAKAPVVGVNVPSGVTRLPNIVAAAPTQGATAGAAGTGGTAAGSASTGGMTPASTSLPTPGTPQVIRDLQTGVVSPTPTSGATSSSVSTLEQYVQDQNLVFNAVVLGPINTAIFRSKDGYVVVASGQPLPDSKVVVGNVTATSAILNLGTDSKTLELDKR
ncbi:hypothetical protein [Deinococcus sp.]|uniref:hypothetical protein n=1 Tax=Deinococcus sp. TaxID=47478 RepID=UPI002869C144|nr:hypothetical protein [Deinococcus sp.]